MRAVDTNVLLRLLVRDDPKQTRAAEAFVANGAWASLLVLAEAVWVLGSNYQRTRDELASTVTVLLKHKNIDFQDPDIAASALDEFRSRKDVGFSDCLILCMARKAGNLPMGTFDKAFAKLDDMLML